MIAVIANDKACIQLLLPNPEQAESDVDQAEGQGTPPSWEVQIRRRQPRRCEFDLTVRELPPILDESHRRLDMRRELRAAGRGNVNVSRERRSAANL
jgi:hypothetical protein